MLNRGFHLVDNYKVSFSVLGEMWVSEIMGQEGSSERIACQQGDYDHSRLENLNIPGQFRVTFKKGITEDRAIYEKPETKGYSN